MPPDHCPPPRKIKAASPSRSRFSHRPSAGDQTLRSETGGSLPPHSRKHLKATIRPLLRSGKLTKNSGPVQGRSGQLELPQYQGLDIVGATPQCARLQALACTWTHPWMAMGLTSGFMPVRASSLQSSSVLLFLTWTLISMITFYQVPVFKTQCLTPLPTFPHRDGKILHATLAELGRSGASSLRVKRK